MRTLLKAFAITLLAALCFAAPSFAQQNSLVQTTLSAAVAAPAAPGAPPVPYAFVQLASVTGIQASSLNPTTTLNIQNLWVIYVDREEMAVINLNGTTLQVVRGYNSTIASAHSSGQMVLYGRASWFYQNDPGGIGNGIPGVGGGTCVLANVVATPWVNVRTGAQWVCSALTLTWAPSWNNPLSNPASWVQTGTIASVAGTTAVSGPYFNVSGTNAITGWTIPLGFNATAFGGGCFTANPTGIWTWTAAGNIATAGTTTAATTPVTFCWNAASSKWIPSRLS